jgi:hypothetical protein
MGQECSTHRGNGVRGMDRTHVTGDRAQGLGRAATTTELLLNVRHCCANGTAHCRARDGATVETVCMFCHFLLGNNTNMSIIQLH